MHSRYLLQRFVSFLGQLLSLQSVLKRGTTIVVLRFRHLCMTYLTLVTSVADMCPESRSCPPGSSAGLREVVERHSQDKPATRSILSLQQQCYQEDQWRNFKAELEQELSVVEHGGGSNVSPHMPRHNDNIAEGYSRDECHSAPPMLSWQHQTISPSPQAKFGGYNRSPFHQGKIPHGRSPNFRRTPGASRPNSRCSLGSSDSRPSSRSSYSSAHSGHYQQTGSHFHPIRQSPTAMDYAGMEQYDYSRETTGEDAPIEVMVSNLDYNISAREWRKILYTEFQQHVQVS